MQPSALIYLVFTTVTLVAAHEISPKKPLACQVPWNSAAEYPTPSIVSYSGNNYGNKWWENAGADPVTNADGGWILIGQCHGWTGGKNSCSPLYDVSLSYAGDSYAAGSDPLENKDGGWISLGACSVSTSSSISRRSVVELAPRNNSSGNLCTNVSDDLIVCAEQGNSTFSICFQGNPVGNLVCAEGTVCCGNGVPACVLPTDMTCLSASASA
ncbi:hypothetical protein HK100_011818 [Physocladia obscura]|uniref:Uncharacterized protein n=1 Tax=Physocladia obscura TaxID=109957 RepID=A0AAD5XGP8_9FUNG|nr:hypothetical protein HK100_011818 [Physocladia obscura]